MRITALEATNVKRLKAVSFAPNGTVVTLTGGNGAGKSSVLDAIFYALGGKKALPSQPIRRGQQSAVIRLTLGELKVTRTLGTDGGTKLVVESVDGARYPTPQAMLDAITGELTFDPLRFANEEPKRQLDVLRSLVKLEVDVDALDRENARDYELRTGFNSRARSFAERVKTVEQDVDWSIDVTPTDVSALVGQVQRAFEHNTAAAKEAERRLSVQYKIDANRATAMLKRDQAKKLLDDARALDALAEADEISVASAERIPAPIDVRGLRAQMDAAQSENMGKERQARAREQLAAAKRELDETKAEAQRLSEIMAHRTHVKERAIATAAMPIEGLTFGNGEVLYKGIPLTQASQGERIRVSFAIAMAANPKLKVVFIRDGSLLDESNLALVGTMAEEHGFQVWIERVDTSGKVGIVIEDGEVKSIDGVPVERGDVAESTSAAVGA